MQSETVLISNVSDTISTVVEMVTTFYYYYFIIKKGWQCKAGRERSTPYQSEDPNPTIQTHIRIEETGKTVEDQKWSEQLLQ